jgi:gamma-glutamylcyclotransferase (GGCT)/AIG2-like uncharacterized protein YtfP
MKSFLFAYGTLQPGNAPPEIRDALKTLRPAGHATTPGQLFDLGDYPGAIFDKSRGTVVRGMVYHLADNRDAQLKLLNRLDEYEGVDGDNSANSLFVRRKISVSLRSGRSLDCWAYEYNKPVAQSDAVFDGRSVGARKKRRTSPKRARSASRVTT